MIRRSIDHKTSWFAEFICGLIGGTMGAYTAGAWMLVSFDWLSPHVALALCAIFGVLFGSWMAIENVHENH